MTPAPPQGVRLAHGRVRPPWRAELTHGTGTYPVQRKGAPRGDGTRPTWMEEAPGESWGLRAGHPDGRRAVALWARAVEHTKWTFVFAWRGRHDDEYGPVPLNSDQLTDYTKG